MLKKIKYLYVPIILFLSFSLFYFYLWKSDLSYVDYSVLDFEKIEYIETKNIVKITGRMRFSFEHTGDFKYYRGKKKIIILMEDSIYSLPVNYWKGSDFSVTIDVNTHNELYYGDQLIWKR